MVPRLYRAGKSFAGLAQYLSCDAKAKTSERVAWTHTLNCTYDDVPSAVNEMFTTFRDAAVLKQEAGIRSGGRALESPVLHFSLNWHPSEAPTREQMIGAAESFLETMGWQDHQAILFSHTDKDHPHLHVMLNRVHPETGRALDDGFAYRRSQAWALAHEREQGQIYCPQRLLDPSEREPSPTRQTWLALKQAEREFDGAETRRAFDPDYLKREDNRRVRESEEWRLLRDHQRAEREGYFADGKQQFNSLRKEIYREIREEFRPEWAEMFAAKREGVDAGQLSEMRADILERQKAALEERRAPACAALRKQRDADYAELLKTQKLDRAELVARQEQGLGSPHLLNLGRDAPRDAYGRDAEPENGDDTWIADDSRQDRMTGFRRAAEEVSARAEDTPWIAEDEPPGMTSAENPRVRDGVNAAGDLGLSMIGALATIAERLFDGFLGTSPAPSGSKAAPEPAPRPRVRSAPDQRASRASEAAQRATEREEEERHRTEYWTERERGRRD